MRHWKVILSVLALVLLAAFGIYGSRGDKLEHVSRRIAVRGAIDCGRVTPFGDRAEANGRVVAAFKARKPFRVRYDGIGIDSRVAVAIVGTVDGRIYILDYDSDPSGGSGVGECVTQSLCTNPVIVDE